MQREDTRLWIDISAGVYDTPKAITLVYPSIAVILEYDNTAIGTKAELSAGRELLTTELNLDWEERLAAYNEERAVVYEAFKVALFKHYGVRGERAEIAYKIIDGDYWQVGSWEDFVRDFGLLIPLIN
jgi:hypothetical protein